MDEPLSNLDAELRVQMRTELKRFHLDLVATIIYVTHDQLEPMATADKIAVMNGGVLQQYASPDEIYNRPTNVFVASFIGSPSMSLLRGDVERTADRLHPSDDGWRSPLPSALASMVNEGQVLMLGVRPSHMLVSHKPLDDGLAIQVLTVEPTGDLTYLPCRAGQTNLIAIVSPEFSVAPSDILRIAFDPQQVHLFDASSGQAIRPTSPTSPEVVARTA